MILIDDRVGSKEMLGYLKDIAALTHLEYGDACYAGNGPEGDVLIGVERKTIGDLIQSMASGRLSGFQLLGMSELYNVMYIVVEGDWRANPESGAIDVRKRVWSPINTNLKKAYTGEMIWNYMNSLEFNWGCHTIYTNSTNETCQWIRANFSWWNSKEYSEHRSHSMSWNPQLINKKVPTIRKVAECFRGIGPTVSKRLESRFGTTKRMINASEKEWRSVEGIGDKIASRVVRTIETGD